MSTSVDCNEHREVTANGYIAHAREFEGFAIGRRSGHQAVGTPMPAAPGCSEQVANGRDLAYGLAGQFARLTPGFAHLAPGFAHLTPWFGHVDPRWDAGNGQVRKVRACARGLRAQVRK